MTLLLDAAASGVGTSRVGSRVGRGATYSALRHLTYAISREEANRPIRWLVSFAESWVYCAAGMASMVSALTSPNTPS